MANSWAPNNLPFQYTSVTDRQTDLHTHERRATCRLGPHTKCDTMAYKLIIIRVSLFVLCSNHACIFVTYLSCHVVIVNIVTYSTGCQGYQCDAKLRICEFKRGCRSQWRNYFCAARRQETEGPPCPSTFPFPFLPFPPPCGPSLFLPEMEMSYLGLC